MAVEIVSRRTTGIEWTEHTWNPFVGCSIESAGCKNCYAMRLAHRIEAFGTVPAYAGTTCKVNGNNVWSGTVNRSSDKTMRKPLGIRGSALIFVNSMSDFFHENADDQWRIEALRVMRITPQHTYQVLTKRPENIGPFLARTGEVLPDNLWLGTTVEDSRVAHRIDTLRLIPAAVRFISFEPLIGDVGAVDLAGILWAISGGESGPKCRPCDAQWARNIRDQCIAQGVAHFFKQWGHWRNNPLALTAPDGIAPDRWVEQCDPDGKGGSLLDGISWKEWPSQPRRQLIAAIG